jgi:phosphate transport system substrate-binding protein
MRNIRALFLLLSAVAVSQPAAAQKETVRIGGTGSSTGIMQVLGDAYSRNNPGIRLTVIPGMGTTGSLAALAAGKLDIAFVPRPLKTEESTRGLAATEFARTPFVIAVKRDHPVSAITLDELARYYAAPNPTWPDGARVRVVMRPAEDSDSERLRAISPAIAAAVDQAMQRPGMIIAATDQDTADILQRTPGALSTLTLGLILAERRPLKALAIDGRKPSLAALESGSYPYAKTLYAFTAAGTGSAAKRFLAFAHSDAGTAILRQHGFLAPRAGK